MSLGARIRNEFSRACDTHWSQERSMQVLVGRSKKSKSAIKSKRRWEDNIKMYLKRPVRVADWIDVAQNREKWQVLVNAVMNLRVS
jgi:hypothetical protein